MKNFVIISVVLAVGFLFYWYEYRPTEIKKKCHDFAVNRAILQFKHDAEEYFAHCLNDKNVQCNDSYIKSLENSMQLETYEPNRYEMMYEECLRRNGID